jgi:hypothetical protein
VTYIKSVIAGIVVSIVSLILLAVIVSSKYRGRGMVAIRIFAPLPLAIMILGFAAGYYVMFRISK